MQWCVTAPVDETCDPAIRDAPLDQANLNHVQDWECVQLQAGKTSASNGSGMHRRHEYLAGLQRALWQACCLLALTDQ